MQQKRNIEHTPKDLWGKASQRALDLGQRTGLDIFPQKERCPRSPHLFPKFNMAQKHAIINRGQEQKTIEYSLDSYNRSNQDTCLLHRPAVYEGQWVQSGDLLADCASSTGGELSLGQNLLIAYMPWEGYNYEDAILISERLVYDDLYTSVHIEKYELETRETKSGKEEITREIPDISQSEINHLDKYGIAKVGSWVEEGDILVGKTTPINKKAQSVYQKLLYTILEKEYFTVRDSSLRAPKGIRAKIVKVQLFKNSKSISLQPKKPKDQKAGSRKILLNTSKAITKITDLLSKNGSYTLGANSPGGKQGDKQGGSGARGQGKGVDKLQETWPYFPNGKFVQSNMDYIGTHPLRFSNGISQREHKMTAQRKKNKGLCRTGVLCSKKKIEMAFTTRSEPLIQQKKTGDTKTYAKVKLTKLHQIQKKSNSSRPNISFTSPVKKSIIYSESHPREYVPRASLGAKGLSKKPSSNSLFSSGLLVHLYLAEKRKVQVGDKLAGRHGNKGIISQILPREDMPYLPDGTPIDMVLNPLGVPSRMNVGQIYECLLGFAGKFLGENYKVFPFDEIYGPEASRSFVYAKLNEARLKTGLKWIFDPNTPGKIRLYDGRTGDCFDQAITVGQAYILRLVHMVDDKIHVRSTGPYSLVTQQPLRGRSKQGGQRLGEMEVWALEGYGAAFTLLEMLTIKSDDMTGRMTLWSNLILNGEISIGTPESFKVLVCELQALCLDIGLFRINQNSLRSTNINISSNSLVTVENLMNLK